jgi:LruC domain-containing protein
VSRDINGNYLSDEGMPWAISFIDDFRLKKRCVYEAYNYFMEWVNSNGVNKNDWYKDKSVT